MPTSNSKPTPSAATDKPLGAPPGNEPYKTIRAYNCAQDDHKEVGTPGDSMYETDRAQNTAFFHEKSAEAPSQEA